jgi:hypothetical protein
MDLTAETTNIIPSTDNTNNLGSSDHRFKDVYTSGKTVLGYYTPGITPVAGTSETPYSLVGKNASVYYLDVTPATFYLTLPTGTNGQTIYVVIDFGGTPPGYDVYLNGNLLLGGQSHLTNVERYVGITLVWVGGTPAGGGWMVTSDIDYSE